MALKSDFAERVKSAVDIVRIVSDYVPLKKAGSNFRGLCPFHNEKTPSFHVHSSRQIFHCFGCGVGGDVFKFVMLADRLSFPEAVKSVAQKAGIPIEEQRYKADEDDPSAQLRKELYRVNDFALNFFCKQLKATGEGSEARDYLKARGVTPEAIERFRIGYAPPNGTLLYSALQSAFGTSPAVEASGLVIKRDDGTGYFDRFRKRVIFPIFRESGATIGFGGRILGEGQPKYLNSPETHVYSKSRTLYGLNFSKDAIKRLDYAILVEGYLDAIGLLQVGIGNVIASCGTSLTDSQVRLLARYTQKIVVNFDPDSAGMAATERSLNTLLENEFQVKVLTLPRGNDPDLFVRNFGVEEYRRQLRMAPTYLDYLISKAAEKIDPASSRSKVEALNWLLPYLSRIGNAIERADVSHSVSTRLGIDDPLVRSELGRAARDRHSAISKATVERLERLRPAEVRVIQGVFDRPDFANELLSFWQEASYHRGLSSERVFEAVLEALGQEVFDSEAVIAKLTEKTDQELLMRILCEETEPLTPEIFADCLGELKRIYLEKERVRLQHEIKAAETRRDASQLQELLRTQQELVRQLAALTHR
ncbi:MAG: DNA primase [Acidobacteriia bacterium]|nr:DNA primase [Terriglobia bacterium]